jgi:hypothetical protein
MTLPICRGVRVFVFLPDSLDRGKTPLCGRRAGNQNGKYSYRLRTFLISQEVDTSFKKLSIVEAVIEQLVVEKCAESVIRMALS